MQYVDGYPIADRRTSTKIWATATWLDIAATQVAADGDQAQADDMRRLACKLRNYVHADALPGAVII